MESDSLTIVGRPQPTDARMVLAFTGWMNGGEVATGTVEHLVRSLGAAKVAAIDAEPFSIMSFPGSMEMSALFRPHIEIEEGLITTFEMPANEFFASEADNLVLFSGREPHLHWTAFAECLFRAAEALGVRMIYFIGTFAGVVPHSREPRLYTSVSDASLKAEMERLGIRFSTYTGPGSFATYLTRLSADRGMPMVSLVAEIPAYVQGRNPKCIEAMVRRLAAIVGLTVDMAGLRAASDAFEERLARIIGTRPELAAQIAKLETEYDSELFDTQMGDLKAWLEQQGIRLD